MASRVVIPEQPRVGGGKQKIVQAEGRNRRVLRDIGNLATKQAVVERKPQNQITRPVTRSFGAQLLANAQAEAEKNICKKPLVESGKDLVGKDVVAAKKEALKPKEEAVVVISSDKGESCKSGRKEKKAAKAFTSILSARSKAACGVTKKPKDKVVDIDAGDSDNELTAAEYVEDMYTYYKLTEGDGRVHDYMESQREINSKMRGILVDWLIEVHKKFELTPESLYLTVNVMDRFLSLKAVPRRELQLVGISSMLIACKYEEIWAPEVSDLMAISDNAYAREQVLVMEKAILGQLEWYLTVPTPYVFLIRYIKASIPSDKEMENMSFFFGELGLTSYSVMTRYSPSVLAASAVYVARCTLGRSPVWSETLRHHTGYSQDQLMECGKVLVGLQSGMAESKLKAVWRKYSNPERAAVAMFPPPTI
ncbi:G2/mitotic-specific cyclin S13-7-like isoform X1 [Salvia hispanica]|uniref:G2/mitotic-specific cyclin S13-7-like isoform X1 n=1 Tax=Salvia hispanica TaxID=49212 RepID=UPI002009CD86|nr:G2/mitotic-specific cyclin S13-7-like isoform X1 [Salvia hispanica]